MFLDSVNIVRFWSHDYVILHSKCEGIFADIIKVHNQWIFSESKEIIILGGPDLTRGVL